MLFSRVAKSAALIALTLGLANCGQRRIPTSPPVPTPPLVDRAAATGLDFVHFSGMTGELYFSELVGSGGALFDYDNDGDLDLYLVQGRQLDETKTLTETLIPWNTTEPPQDRLFRNDLEADGHGKPRPRFVDVTAESGLENLGYGMGVAAGDIDNDGWTDLYITHFGSNRMWRNNGPGAEGAPVTFTDITETSATDDPRWSTSAAFFDFDRDGWLDLYVANYVDFRIANHEVCVNEMGVPDYCGPHSYRPETDHLWRNETGLTEDGSIRFKDVSNEAGLLSAPGPGLGVVTADFDGDGRIDIYVANDQAQNHLWRNLSEAGQPIRFVQEALERGSAVDSQGRVQASMGIDAADIDRDGDLDLFMTHLLREFNTLYLNDGNGWFRDRSTALGLATSSVGYTGFGTAFFDLDNDGWLDLITANGEVRLIAEQQAAGDPVPLKQPNQLFRNQKGRFVDASAEVPDLAIPLVSRGLIIGDIDNDGDADAVVCNNSAAVQLLINQVGQQAHWLGLRLLNKWGRDALGARVILQRDGEPPLLRLVRTDGSYLAANDPRVLFGLDDRGESGRVEVSWPSGRRESWTGLEIDRYHTLIEGQDQLLTEGPS